MYITHLGVTFTPWHHGVTYLWHLWSFGQNVVPQIFERWPSNKTIERNVQGGSDFCFILQHNYKVTWTRLLLNLRFISWCWRRSCPASVGWKARSIPRSDWLQVERSRCSDGRGSYTFCTLRKGWYFDPTSLFKTPLNLTCVFGPQKKNYSFTKKKKNFFA